MASRTPSQPTPDFLAPGDAPRLTDGHRTRERLLDVAERELATHGIAGTSLRAITRAAQVNLAAVHYHFGSKAALVQAVYERRLAPINRERLRLLDACEAAAGERPPQLESVVAAFVEPVLRLRQRPGAGGEHFMCLMSRIFTEGHEALGPVMRQFDEVRRRFPGALQRSLPHLSRQELLWRMHFFIGATMHVVGAGHLLRHFSDGLCDPADVEGSIRRLVSFVSAGLRAPAPAATDPGAGA